MPDVEPTTQTEEEVTEEVVVEPTVEGEPADGQQPAVPTTRQELTPETPREKALMAKARADEKQKLYKDINTLKEQIKELQDHRAQQPQTPAGRKKRDDDDEEISQLRTSVATLTAKLEAQEKNARLKEYKDRVIAEAKRKGERLIEALVYGDSEEAIDIALEVSKAEATLAYEDAKKELAPAPKPNGGAPRTVVVKQPTRQPENVPPVVSGAGSGNDDPNTISRETLADLCSMDSIRDGTFESKRAEIHKALREGRIR